MELRLTSTQLAYLRREPTTAANKVLLALSLRQARQQDLADATGLQKSKISEVINGHYTRISLNTARTISGALGACIEDIFPPSCTATRRKRIA